MSKTRIVLVAPSIKQSLEYGIADGNSAKMSSRFGTYPPLGLCYIAAVLIENGFSVEIIDIDAEGIGLDEAVRRVTALRPDLVGITSMSFTFIYALELARRIKLASQAPVVIGGNHVTIYPQEVMSHSCFDVGVIGEGERTFLELCLQLRQRGAAGLQGCLKDIPGLVFRDNGTALCTPVREFIRNLDELPFPAIGLLRRDKYCGCNLAEPYTTMMTSRGCPYNCSFCSKAPWGQSYRSHSAERVVSDIERLINEFGIKAIDFFDDSFTVSRERTYAIIALIRQKKLNFEFGIVTRADLVDEEMLGELRSVGCKIMAIGVESGAPRVLKELNKELDLDKVVAAFAAAARVGIRTVGFFLIGNPTETLEDVHETIRFIKRLNADWFKANILIPYPGSPLYDGMLRSGQLQEDYWRRFTISPTSEPPPPASRIIDDKTLRRLRDRIDLMPYLRVRSNIFKLGKIRSFDDFKRSFLNVVSFLTGSDK